MHGINGSPQRSHVLSAIADTLDYISIIVPPSGREVNHVIDFTNLFWMTNPSQATKKATKKGAVTEAASALELVLIWVRRLGFRPLAPQLRPRVQRANQFESFR